MKTTRPRKHRGFYTPDEDSAIRAGWPDYRAVAKQLGRTELGVRGRGVVHLGLGCPSGQKHVSYTEAERAMVLKRYAREGATPLAIELGRSRECIVGLAARLGTRFDGLWPWTADEDARLKDMVALRRTEDSIATALGRLKTAVAKRKAHLGLTVRLYDPQVRRRHLQATHTYKDNRSIPAERRWAKDRISLGEHGWPPDLSRKEVAILESLRVHGPQTRRILSLSIGEPRNRADKKRLQTHGGASSMARVLARGLVTRLFLRDRRRATVIYALTANGQRLHGTFQSVREFNSSMLGRMTSVASHARRQRQATYRQARRAA